MIEIKCLICGKSIFTSPSRIGRKKYCSKKCQYTAMKKLRVSRVERVCKTCGKKFYLTKNKLKGKRGKYCSKNCEWLGKRKDGNPMWKGNNVAFASGRMRARRWFGYGKFCEVCGAQKAEIHHKDGNPLNNDTSNIMWVCRKCHVNIDQRNKRTCS